MQQKQKQDFLTLIREAAAKCDVLVIAGGDGSFSDAVNALPLKSKPLGILPLGSGDANFYQFHPGMKHLRTLQKLAKRATMAWVAQRIKNGSLHTLDLLVHHGRTDHYAFLASVGMDAYAVYQRNGSGWDGYVDASLHALRNYKPCNVDITVGGLTERVNNLMTCIVTKWNFYGYGLHVCPEASPDDGQLHVQTIAGSKVKALAALATGGIWRNTVGTYRSGEVVKIRTEAPISLHLQLDGDKRAKSKQFHLSIAPESVQLVY